MSLLRRLSIERLEDRRLLAVVGVPWPEAANLSLSFAPDGTLAGNQTSDLFSSLNPPLPVDVWQPAILRAIQTWAVESNINIGLVADGGQSFNSLGFKQGDLRFGDIRIGAFPMGGDVLAVANPYDPFVVNTWVGDVFLNSAYEFDVDGAHGGYDLYSVMLHEAGHVLGVGHSDDPNSPMFEHFRSVQTGLTAPDIADIQQLYGTRHADTFDALATNDTRDAASLVSPNSSGEIELVADLTHAADVDYYRIDVPVGAASMTVDLTAAGVSLLVARLSIIDANGQVVTSSAASDPRDNDVELALAGLHGGETYYVRVEAAANDVFGVGAYELEVIPSTASTLQNSAGVADSGVESTTLDARQRGDAELLATTPGYVEHTYYEIEGTLSNVHTERTYRVRSVDLGPGITNVMTVIVDNYGSPNVQTTIYDDQGREVTAEVIAQSDDEIALQISGVLSAKDYFIRVHGENYVKEAEVEIEVDFAHDSTHLEQLVSGSLAAGASESLQTLTVNQSQLFHWVLSGSDWSQPQETGVQMNVVDAAGQTVYRLAAADGASRSGDVFLAAGQYTVRFTRAVSDTATPVIFKLSGLTTSEPLGPQLRDTTQNAVDTSSVAQSQLSAYWSPGALSVSSNAATQTASFWWLSNQVGQTSASDAPRSATSTSFAPYERSSTRELPAADLAVEHVDVRASSLLDNNTSAIHETRPATTGQLTENVTDLNAASALISLMSLSRSHRTSLAAEIYEGTDAVVNNEPSDESASDPNTAVDHGFASIALSDPIFMLAAFGGVAWNMLVRQRLAGNRPRIAAWSQRMRRRLNVLTRANT